MGSELDELRQSVKRLNAVLNEFPIGAISLDDFTPVEEKIQATRESLMRLNAKLLMYRAKCQQYINGRWKQNANEAENVLQNVISDTLVNAKAVKLCLHSVTIASILDNKEGSTEEQKKLDTYINKLFTLNDNIMAIQESVEEASLVQLGLKLECQKTLFDYKTFLNNQEQLQREILQETHPEIVKNKRKMEKTIWKINIMKKLIRNFIAASGHMIAKEPILSEMLEKHRDLVTSETIVKLTQNKDSVETR